MKNKIVIFNIVIITLAMLAVFFFGLSTNRSSHYEEAEKHIKQVAEIYLANYDAENPAKAAESVPDGIRVTVIASDGTVIADSQDSSLTGTSHIDREEFVAAMQGKPEFVTRYSETLKTDMMYYAVKAENCVIRIAVPVENVESYVKKTVPTMIYVLLIALATAYVAGIIATNGIVKPLSDVKNRLADVKNGTYGNAIPATGDKEINAIITEINGISDKLSESIKETNGEKERLGYLLRNISDGIVVTDHNGVVTEINKVATEIFGVTAAKGKNASVLIGDKEFNGRLSDCLRDGSAQEYELKTGGKTYMCTFKKLETNCALIVLTDITAVKDGERTRAEFFANASHELKTPLTAIKGFNDIIGLKTKEDGISELSGKIDKEVARIINLINDMLGLSELETEKPLNLKKINLVSIAEEVKESLSELAARKNVSVSVNGKGTVTAEKKHAVALMKNLVENGIRYNTDGGSVNVNVKTEKGKTTLTVSDDGIGIEEEHLGRIFERFYRVNKSRSVETGGTGLGLAIVKHVCSLYGAEVSVSSKYGEGTTVTVVFPAATKSV